MKNKIPTHQEIKVKGSFNIIASLVIVILIFSFFLASCGAKKTDKTTKSEVLKMERTDKSQSEQSEQSETNIDTNVKKSETITVNNQDQTTVVEETVEPVDNTKPSSYIDTNGKKQELHNAKKTTKTTVKKNNSNTNSNSNTEASQKTDIKASKKSNSNANIKVKAAAKKIEADIHVDKKAWSLWSLSWLLVLVPVALGIKWIWNNKTKIAAKMWWM